MPMENESKSPCPTRMLFVSMCPGELILLPVRLERILSYFIVDHLNLSYEILSCNIPIT